MSAASPKVKAPILTKETIIANTAEATGLTKADIDRAYTALLTGIRQGLLDGNDVRLSGIGTLRTQMAGARVSRNVRTQEPINIPARLEVKFRVSDDLKKVVAGIALA